jgi:hypothetical protein
MTSTIETNNSNVLKKIECLKKISLFLEKYIPNSQLIVKENRELIDKLFNDYSIEFAVILTEYFQITGSESSKKKEQYNKLYQRCIKSNNITSRLDTIYNDFHRFFVKNTRLKNIPELFDPKQKIENRLYKECSSLFLEYNKIKIHMYIEEVKINSLCTICNEQMMITDIGEQSCIKCGRCQDTAIAIIDDDGISDNKNIKYGSYDPSKHCRYWLDRIQGREIGDITEIEKIVEYIKKQLLEDRIKNIDYITYTLIRNYLQKNNYSAYNEHIPLIRKLLTGISPPQLTENELQKINIYFIRVIKLYNTIKPSTKINCPYHPYIIYKILEQIMIDGPRKSAILRCIHLQSSQTLIQNDKLWQKICENIPEFTYIPTDRNRL